MNRFDIADRKGLEITLLTTLLTFQDLSTANTSQFDESSVSSNTSQFDESSVSSNASQFDESSVRSHPVHVKAVPPVPPRPAPKTGVDRVAEMHAMRYEPNEVTVGGEGSVENYGEYAEGLLAVCLTRFPFRPLSDIDPTTG